MNIEPDVRIKRLEEIRNELFTIANSYVGKETGVVAVKLHKAKSLITEAIDMIERGVSDQDNKDVMREYLVELSMKMAGITK